jgi:hypothetical protein
MLKMDLTERSEDQLCKFPLAEIPCEWLPTRLTSERYP